MNKKKEQKTKGIFYFKQWSRKQYSIMHSLKNVVKISVLSVGYLLHSFTGSAQTDTLKLEEIQVKAARNELKYSDAVRMLTLIDKEEISSMPASDISTVLSSAMSIDVRERGAGGVQADFNMRGGSFEQALVLINGMRINDPQTGHFSLNLPIDANDISRIEILSGPAARIYGNNAFSGAINIITGKSDRNFIKFSGIGGSYGYYDAKIASNYKIKNFTNYLSVSKTASQGYKENTDFNIDNIYYSANQYFDNSTLNVQAGYTAKAFGANSFYTPVFPNQYEENKTAFANIRYRSDKKIKMTYAGYWRFNYDKFELFRNNPPSWYQGANYHKNNTYGVSVNSSFNALGGTSSLGAEWNKEQIISNKLGDSLKTPKLIKETSNRYYTKGNERQNFSLFAEQQYSVRRFNIIAGLMSNYNTVFAWNFYPGIDLGYAVNRNFKLSASANFAGRIPSFTELYYVGPTNTGNSELKVEKSFTYETGIKYFNKFAIIQAAIFRRLGSNIIDWVKQNPDDLWKPENITHVNATGIELSANFKLKKLNFANFPVNYVRINYAYTQLDKNSGNYISKYALDYLVHNFNISLGHNIYKNIKASWVFQYRKRNGTFIPYDSEQGIWLNAENYKAIYLLNFKLHYSAKHLKVFTEANNLFNIKYQDIENVALPGIWIKAGVSYKLNLFSKNKD
ncbi:MAG: TonB-dependent receptor [Bacteroidales bacterium]|nr:TonB-dependent receptor [Bacteroidales bacterium]